MATSSFAFKKHFACLRDPRIRNRKRHYLMDILVIALCAVLCGAKTWPQVAAFGRRRQDWLQKFLPLPNGIPSHDTFERVFDRLQPLVFQRCFLAWTQALSAGLGIDHLAIDGKTLRSSGNAAAGLGPLHLVSAWASQLHLTLGQVAVDSKSNEITAIPKLLELLDLHGALVTIDAIGCQKKIAAQIVEGGGDYVLAVKDNQGHLLDDIQASFEQALDTDFAGWRHDTYETAERGHGRHEKRWYTVLYDLDQIRDVQAWTQLRVIGMCYSERTVQGETSSEARYFIGSRETNATVYGEALRHHWGIENNLHWQLDVTFCEDANRVQNRQAAENLALVRRMALSLLKRHPSKESMDCKRLEAALDTQFLEEILNG
jgi:predicted transposase YbfD/YdcC